MSTARVTAALTAFVAVAVLARAQSPSSAIPNLSGVWDNTHVQVNKGGPSEGPPGGFLGPGGIPSFGFTTEEPEMLPEAAARYRAIRTGVVRGPLDRGIGRLDPANKCFPHGPTRVYTIPRPWELRQFADVVFLLFEADHTTRRIFVDGRPHSPGYPISWMGHSIGRYEGDTLVADTVAMHDETWIDTMGHIHSEALRIEERFHLTDPNTLQIDLLFDDPETYVRPWTGKKVFLRAPPGFEVLEEVICEEWFEIGKHREPQGAVE